MIIAFSSCVDLVVVCFFFFLIFITLNGWALYLTLDLWSCKETVEAVITTTAWFSIILADFLQKTWVKYISGIEWKLVLAEATRKYILNYFFDRSISEIEQKWPFGSYPKWQFIKQEPSSLMLVLLNSFPPNSWRYLSRW